MTAATPGRAAQALALLDEVLEDVAHVVGGNPDWIAREMLNDYSERAEAIAAQEPHAAPVEIDEHRHYAIVHVAGQFALAAVHHSLDGLVIYTDEAEFEDAKARDFE